MNTRTACRSSAQHVLLVACVLLFLSPFALRVVSAQTVASVTTMLNGSTCGSTTQLAFDPSTHLLCAMCASGIMLVDTVTTSSSMLVSDPVYSSVSTALVWWHAAAHDAQLPPFVVVGTGGSLPDRPSVIAIDVRSGNQSVLFTVQQCAAIAIASGRWKSLRQDEPEPLYVLCQDGSVQVLRGGIGGVASILVPASACVEGSVLTADFDSGILYVLCTAGILAVHTADGTYARFSNDTRIASLQWMDLDHRGISGAASTGLVLVASDGTVYSVNFNGTNVTSLATLPPGVCQSIQTTPQGVIYISSGLILWALRGAAVTTIAPPKFCAQAQTIVYDQLSMRLYVSCLMSENSVMAVTLATWIPLGNRYSSDSMLDVAVRGDTGEVLVGSSTNPTLALDGTTWTHLLGWSQCSGWRTIKLVFDPAHNLRFTYCASPYDANNLNLYAIDASDQLVAITSLEQISTLVQLDVLPTQQPSTLLAVSGFDKTQLLLIRVNFSAPANATSPLGFPAILAQVIALQITQCTNPTRFTVDTSLQLVAVSCWESSQYMLLIRFADLEHVGFDGRVNATSVIPLGDTCGFVASMSLDAPRFRLIIGCGETGLQSLNLTSGVLTSVCNDVLCHDQQTGSMVAFADTIGDGGVVFADIDGLLAVARGGVAVRLANPNMLAGGATQLVWSQQMRTVIMLCESLPFMYAISIDAMLCPSAYELNSDGSCAPCQPGTSRNQQQVLAGNDSCVSCAEGAVSPLPGAQECTVCSPGKYAAASVLPCEACPIARYSDEFRVTRCTACPAGRIGNTLGLNSSRCSEESPPGYWSTEGSTKADLLDCGARSVWCAAGSTHPTGVSAGCYTTGSIDGTERTMSSETECGPGSYCDGSGAPKLCAPGSFSASNRTVECSGCEVGRFSSKYGAMQCEPCPAGSIAPQRFSSYCTTCPTGSQAVTANGTQSCVAHPCPPNHVYEPTQAVCQVCTLGTAGIGACVVCSANFYTPHMGADCRSCIDVPGLTCNYGLASVDQGYWAWRDCESNCSSADDDDENNLALYLFHTVACPPNFCQGAPLQISEAINGTAVVIQQCAWPRANDADNSLCASCVDGYMPWGNECKPCEKVNALLLFGLLLLSIAATLFLIWSSGSAASYLSVCVFYFQTGALMVSPVSHWLDWTRVLNFDLGGLGSCLAPIEPFEQALLRMLTPIILLLELLLLALLHSCVHRCMMARKGSEVPMDAAVKFSLDRYIRAGFSIMMFTYTGVAQASISLLQCVDVDHRRVVFTAPTIDCASDQYQQYRIIVAVVIAVVVAGFPAMTLVLVARSRRALFAAAIDASPTAAHESIPSVGASQRERLAPLIGTLQARSWYWQSLALIRRTLFVLIDVLLVQRATTRFLCYTLLLLGLLQLHIFVWPFAKQIVNRLEMGSYVALLITAIILTGNTPPYEDDVQIILLLLLAVAGASLLCVSTYQQVRHWRKGWAQRGSGDSQKNRADSLHMHAAIDEVGGAAATHLDDSYAALPSGPDSLPARLDHGRGSTPKSHSVRSHLSASLDHSLSLSQSPLSQSLDAKHSSLNIENGGGEVQHVLTAEEFEFKDGNEAANDGNRVMI